MQAAAADSDQADVVLWSLNEVLHARWQADAESRQDANRIAVGVGSEPKRSDRWMLT